MVYGVVTVYDVLQLLCTNLGQVNVVHLSQVRDFNFNIPDITGQCNTEVAPGGHVGAVTSGDLNNCNFSLSVGANLIGVDCYIKGLLANNIS